MINVERFNKRNKTLKNKIHKYIFKKKRYLL